MTTRDELLAAKAEIERKLRDAPPSPSKEQRRIIAECGGGTVNPDTPSFLDDVPGAGHYGVGINQFELSASVVRSEEGLQILRTMADLLAESLEDDEQ